MRKTASLSIVAIFYPFSQFCEIIVSLLSLQKQPNAAPNLFQRGVEYGKYGKQGGIAIITTINRIAIITSINRMAIITTIM